MTSQLDGWPHFLFFLFIHFLKLIITFCKLCVIYVKEDNDSNV